MYVEFYIETEILQNTLQQLSDVDLVVHELATGGETPLRLFGVASGDDVEAFEAGLEEDDTVAEFECLSQEPTEHVYQIVAESGTVDQRIHEASVDLGGVYITATNADGAWYLKMNFPDRQSFRQFQATAEDHGADVQPTIMRDEKFFLPDRVCGFTEKQQEALSEAVKTGYFEVPRRASLSDIANRVGISDQAASERLRRALRTIAESGVSRPATAADQLGAEPGRLD